MAIVTVTIKKSGNLEYSPSNKVRHGDTVQFVLDQVSAPMWAKVNPPECLVATASVTLNKTAATPPVYEDPVAPDAAYTTYPFTVEVPPATERSHVGGEFETKNGNLDVTTDPPKR